LVRHDAPPGEIILEGCLKPWGLSQNALARAIGVPPRRMEIVLGRRAVAADADLRLTACFGLSEGFFMRLQVLHDLRAATPRLSHALRQIKPHEKRDGVLVAISPNAA
jgi:addiction module HigA family antidote